jgi:hypothetical protein
MYFSDVKGLLCISGVQIPPEFLATSATAGAHQQCSRRSVFNLNLVCYVTNSQ